jgi:hypothetical protein
VRVRFGKQIWDLTLYEPGSEVGLELVAATTSYTGVADKDAPEVDVALLVLKGEVSLKTRLEEYLVQPGFIVTWDNSTGAAGPPAPMPHLPDWYTGKDAITTPAARDATAALGNLALLSTTKSLEVALGECLNSSDAATRLLAVRCQAALGQMGALFGAVGDEKHPEVRRAGVEGLRHALAVDPAAVAELQRIAREHNLTDKQLDTMRHLLQGFDAQQWADPAVRASVVDYLLHDKLVVRQLAYSLLLRTYPEGQKIGYDAAADPRQRDHAYEEWKVLVQQNKMRPN